MTDKTIWVCNYCGSEEVYYDAFASVNDPNDVLTYDYTYCMSCEGETSLIEQDKFDYEKEVNQCS